MNTISTPQLANRPRKGSFPLLLAAALSLVWISGCLPSRKPSLPPASPPASPAALPTPTPIAERQEPDLETSFSVVGIQPGDSLALHQEPSPDSQVLGTIPPAGLSIHPLQGSPQEGTDPWQEVDYQGLQGWAERAHLALQQGDLPPQLARLGQFVAYALQHEDYDALEDLIHPELCLRFSPYQYLRETDQVLCPAALEEVRNSGEAWIWGNFDGSGEPILMTFQEYHDRFVYDEDFFQPQVVGFNQEVSQGNTINNIPDIYPDGMMVEYYFPGFDPQYGGMDWRSLRLVFVNQAGQWYLAALVHGEWTI